jgi:hypothetical protein
MKKKYYYKVCSLNQWVKPKLKGSKLYVFSSYKKAEDGFFGENFIIFKCEVKNPVNVSTHAATTRWEYLSEIKRFWKEVNLKATENKGYSFVICDEIKLIEEVKQ